MRISDWSSDVCSSDLPPDSPNSVHAECRRRRCIEARAIGKSSFVFEESSQSPRCDRRTITRVPRYTRPSASHSGRSEEHTSELQSLMRISYAVFCLKKKNKTTQNNNKDITTNN